MADVDAAIDAGEQALNSLYALQTAAMKAGDLATQKALSDDIDDLTYKLTQLRSSEIAADDTQIAALSRQLDEVTASAQADMADLTRLNQVLSDVLTATKLLDAVIGAAPK
jgi:DNA repair exonuclease SbcCD ATPase subunit